MGAAAMRRGTAQFLRWGELLPMGAAAATQQAMARAVVKVVAKQAASTMRTRLRAAGVMAAGIGEATETLEHYSELCLTGAVESARAFLRVIALCCCRKVLFKQATFFACTWSRVLQKGFLERATSACELKKKGRLCTSCDCIPSC